MCTNTILHQNVLKLLSIAGQQHYTDFLQLFTQEIVSLLYMSAIVLHIRHRKAPKG